MTNAPTDPKALAAFDEVRFKSSLLKVHGEPVAVHFASSKTIAATFIDAEGEEHLGLYNLEEE